MAESSISLEWKYIKYDIDQETYKAGNLFITGEENAEVRNEAQTGISDFDQNFCRRKIEQALLNLQEIMHKFFDTISRSANNETEELTGNALSTGTDKWTISLNIGDRRQVDSYSLGNVMHKYIVLYVLQEWAKIALPALEKNYVERMLAEENRIKTIIYRKTEPTYDNN